MTKGRLTPALIVVATVLVAALAIHTKQKSTDPSGLVLGVATLLVTSLTLIFVVPGSARLLVQRQTELANSDLIFYVYPQPARGEQQQVPRDFLLQLVVAVINTGGRKGVLSLLELVEFLDSQDRPVRIPEVPSNIGAAMASQESGWSLEGGRSFRTLSVGPPFVLDPDDVISLRFSCRRGVDWSDRWDLQAIKAIFDSLDRPIASARLRMVYRRGSRVVEERVKVPISVEQQELYRGLLARITQEFLVRPVIKHEPIQMV